MAAIDPGHPQVRGVSLPALLGRHVVYQLKLLARSPMAAFATLVIPLMVLLAVNLLYSGTRLSSRGGIAYAQFFTPAMVAFALVNACYMSVISSAALARDQGILKRIRSTPLPSWVYMAGRVVSSGLVAVVGGGRRDRGRCRCVRLPRDLGWGPSGAADARCGDVLLLLAGAGGDRAGVPSESAVPIAWGTMLPLCFISDVFQPIDSAPH
jgi:ABC-2 type transport system permease protein